MGGMLAQVISSRHNSLVRKVILSCTHKGYAIPEGNALIEPFEKRLEERKNLSDQEFGILRVNEMLPELKNKEIFFLKFFRKVFIEHRLSETDIHTNY